MRMRRKKNLIPRLEKCAALLVRDPQLLCGKWREHFGMSGELHLEIGCGKGSFIIEMAKSNPKTMFVAVEKDQNVLLLALEAALSLKLPNLIFISAFAESIDLCFAKDEVQRIYLNFSDPWPASNRAKRRLSHSNFLCVYDRFLQDGGSICMKTDNQRLFEFSLSSFSQFGYILHDISLDLHKTDTPNIMTEYEMRFAEQGMSIHRCVAKKPLSKPDSISPTDI